MAFMLSNAEASHFDVGLVRPRSGYAGVVSELGLCPKPSSRLMRCALPRQHVLARKRTIAISDLAGSPLIAGGPGISASD
jgi:hypothetical protein